MPFLTIQSTLIGPWLVTALVIFGLMAFVGMVAFKILYRHKNVNSLILLGGGMIAGPLIFLLSLNFLSYVFKGRVFLTILFIFFVVLSIYLVKKMRINLFAELFSFRNKDNKKSKLIYILLALNILLIYVFVGRANVGGDVLQYWAIATSFARGNFPTVMPYQPDFLTVYHTGTYLVLGLLHVLTNFDIDRVHFFFAFYIMTSIFLLTTGMALKKNHSIIGLIPPIFGLILFGGPIILTEFNYQNIFNILTKYPTFEMNIGSIGGGAISPESLIYMIQIAFSLAVFLLFVYILAERNKSKPFKDYVLLTLLTNLNLSINEVFLPIQLFLIAVFFIYDYRKSLKEFLIKGVIMVLIFSGLFFVVQNSTRDSLFTPSPEAPRFQIVIPPFKSIEQFTNPLRPDPQFRQDIVTSTDGKGTSWYLVDIRILILLGLMLSLITQETIPLILSLSALISLLCEIFISYTFSPWANFRFFSQSYQLMAFAFGFLIVGLFKRRKLKFVMLVILFLVLPQVVSSYMKVLNVSLSKNNQNYTAHNPENKSLKEISRILPAKSRVLIISFLPSGNINQYGPTLDALVRYGLIVPTAPPDTKILNIATGIEWYDAATYLDPPSVSKLGVDYVYLDAGALKLLPSRRIKQIQDISYFKPVVKTVDGELFKVTDDFKALQDESNPTLRKMVGQIENNKYVYLDKVEGDIRRLMFLSLYKKHAKLFGRDYLERFGGDYYMAVEIPFLKITEDTQNVHDIDYAVMKPGLNPSDFIYGKYQKIAETKFAYLWKRMN